jgi:accessory gene regulator protein AgrB
VLAEWETTLQYIGVLGVLLVWSLFDTVLYVNTFSTCLKHNELLLCTFISLLTVNVYPFVMGSNLLPNIFYYFRLSTSGSPHMRALRISSKTYSKSY